MFASQAQEKREKTVEMRTLCMMIVVPQTSNTKKTFFFVINFISFVRSNRTIQREREVFFSVLLFQFLFGVEI